MTILIVSAGCCYPKLAAFDEPAKQIVETAASSVGITANIQIVPATTAYYGGFVPKQTLNKLMKEFTRNASGPYILIGGEVVAKGVPKLEEMTAILNNLKNKE